MRRLAGIVGAALLLAAVSGCDAKGNLTGQKSTVQSSPGTSKAKPAGPQAAKVGQTLRITGDGGLSAAVTVSRVVAHAKGQGELAEPSKNGVYEVAHVTIAVTAGDYDFNPLYFKWVSAAGDAYSSFDGNGATAGFDPALSSGTLHAGQRAGGYVTFDVPKGHGTVQITDPLGGVVGEWRA
jgi:LysM repeat protein